MLAPLHPSSPTSDQAVRDLLDQRARASHTRYTSVSFSQRSDSPSIYSRGDLSPNPLYAPLGELPVRSRYPVGQSTFNDAEEDLQRPPSTASSLIDGDSFALAYEDEDGKDGTSFISTPTPRPLSRRDVDNPHAFGPEFGTPSTEKIEEDPRLSLLGPKMRFVSRAPWETGEDDLLEADEEDAGTAPDGLSIFGGKVGGWRGRDPEKSSVKGLGLATFRSRSPGPSASVKKSGIGMPFGLTRHKTPEPRSESPYGPHLSGASQSQSAVNTTSSARSSHSVTDSQSSHNLRYKAPISSPMSKANTLPPLPSPKAIRTQKRSFSSQDDSSVFSFRSDSPPPPVRFVHPYANPDLIPAMGLPPPTPLPRTPRTPRKSQDHSSEEHNRRSSPSRRRSESSQTSPRPVKVRKAPAGGVALSESQLWNADDKDRERENSHLFVDGQVLTPADETTHKPYPEQNDGPMRSLISLEQARARAQNPPYLSSSTQSMGTESMPKSTPTSTLVAGLGLAPGVVVENGAVRAQGRQSTAIPFPNSEPPGPPPQTRDWQRPRTTSSGKYMGGGGATPRPDGDVAVKTLKHKKSAFMKLFQGGKDKEREKELPKEPSLTSRTPPVRAVSTPPQVNTNEPTPSLPSALNVKRVPPPQLSVVVTSPSIGASGPLAASVQEFTARPDSPPRVRQASSPLPSSGDYKTQVSENQDRWPPLGEPPRLMHISPSSSSAPPSQTEFKTLSLRPVSTMFSANFPDLLSPSSPQSNPPKAWNHNHSYPSPTTPGFDSSRSNSMSTASDYPRTPTSAKPYPGVPGIMPSPIDDQSSVIAALQEQIINSRKAWQRQIWELEGQVKDLKTEVEELRNTGECETCGKAKRDGRIRTPATHGVVDRPRPRMGGNTRSVFGGGNDM